MRPAEVGLQAAEETVPGTVAEVAVAAAAAVAEVGQSPNL